MKSVEFIIGFINQVKNLKGPTLAALFIKRSGVVDEVLETIEYNDGDLMGLTDHRPELAEPPYILFNVIDKIKDPENQEEAARWGVINLVNANKHDSVIPLVNALEKRQFNSRDLTNAAIQQAFHQGAWRGIKYIVEEFHEHPAITPELYADGLIDSWKYDKSNTFPFLLDQADQGDLEKVKRDDKYKKDPEFSKAIDDAISKAGPAGTRHARPAERVRLAKETFSEFPSTNLSPKNGGGPENIIFDYILG